MASEEVEGGLRFESGPSLRAFLSRAASDPAVSAKARAAALRYAEDESMAVPFSFLRAVYGALGSPAAEGDPLHRVLAGSAFLLEPPRPREKSEELKARLRRLQDLADEREYRELVRDVVGPGDAAKEERFSSFGEQLGFGLHVALTMFTGFAFFYTVFRALFRDQPVLHAAGGALGLILGMLLETLLFIVRDAQQQRKADANARKRTRRKKQS